MNSRERVLATLNHKEPDKVPIDMGGNQSSIHIKAYRKLLDYLNIEDTNMQYSDIIQQIAYPCEELLEYFEVDFRYLRPPGSFLPEKHKLGVVDEFQGLWDQFGVFWGISADKEPEDILYLDPCIHPLNEMTTVQQVKEYDWPDGKDKRALKELREQAKKLRKTTEYAISTPPLGCIYEYTTFLFGFSKALQHLHRNPELVIAAMEELEKYWTDYATTFLNEVKFGDEHYVDVVCNNGDLAEQSGPIMNPKRIYEPLIKPIEYRFSKRVHELADIKMNYHCCGSLPHFIPHFSDIEYDAVNPVQVSAFDMEPCSLKQRFGSSITLWGGLCDTQKTLPFGTPNQIRQEVRYNMECFKSGGGYIASNIHNITAEVPAENIVAMFEAVKEFRPYY